MLRLALLLLPLAPSVRAEDPVRAEPPVLASGQVPASVLPHCLYGLDPHAQAVQPWPSGPNPVGYRLEPASRLHLLTWLGFEAGDLLLAVNGHALGGAEHHFAARKATAGAASCAWTVQRDDARGEIRVDITPDPRQELVLERDADGMPKRLSRAAIWQRLSNPYAFGRYASVLAMGADDGVYAVDKGLVSLMTDLGFQPLDHHLGIGGVDTTSGQKVLEGLGHLLTDDKLRWEFRRGGQVRTLTLRIEGDPVALPAWGASATPPRMELPSEDPPTP
jgi:hypothetical protein